MSKSFMKSQLILSILMLSAVFLLVGCNSLPTQPVEQLSRIPPAQDMVKSPEVLPDPSGPLPGDLMQTAITYANAYHECRVKLDGLIDFVNGGTSAPVTEEPPKDSKPWYKFW